LKGYLETLRKAAAAGNDTEGDKGTEYDDIDDKDKLAKILKDKTYQHELASN
jgi:hypothetical protein